MSEEIRKYEKFIGTPNINIEWGTHTICEACGEKVVRGIIPTIEHSKVCLGNRTEDADFEIIEPKMIENEKRKDL